MTKLREIYYCEICGNVVEIMNEGQPALVCCDQPMNKLEAKTEDSTVEKHVPYVEEKDGGVLVKVGQNAAHPMEEKHHIKFIEVLTKDKVCRAELQVGEAPEAWFPIKKEDIVATREWCNIHGLWES
ncbi:MAG: desulfoferrodoxin [Candidatus Cloacimonetes bacterium]|nr:desulfoferrodoxin [Candidatus Cloacimonadota bacterium]MCF7867244.1 desulfoferrodoxin [Candidatus Cloacimonadota bacterium]MCF7882688.1 desulfoferrodoxin [Candidatus Cloacimonadota bacterium]